MGRYKEVSGAPGKLEKTLPLRKRMVATHFMLVEIGTQGEYGFGDGA